MVNLKLRRIMIIVLCVFFTVTVFRCQVYESTWGIAKKQMRFDKETQTEQITADELDKFIVDFVKWKKFNSENEQVASFEVKDVSETISLYAKIWFVYHQWDVNRFFYVQSRIETLLKFLNDKSDIENIVKQLEQRDDEASKSMLDLQKKRYEIIMKNKEELLLVEKKKTLLKKLFK